MLRFNTAYLISALQVQPEMFGGPEKTGQAKGRIGADAPLFENDVIEARCGHVQAFRQFIHRHADWFQKLLAQDLARMDSPVRYSFSDGAQELSLLMIVCDLNVVSAVLAPHETNPVLVVDSDAVLSATVSPQLLQAISRRNHQVVEFECSVKHGEFSLGRARRQYPFRLAGSPDLRRPLIGESLDH